MYDLKWAMNMLTAMRIKLGETVFLFLISSLFAMICPIFVGFMLKNTLLTLLGGFGLGFDICFLLCLAAALNGRFRGW